MDNIIKLLSQLLTRTSTIKGVLLFCLTGFVSLSIYLLALGAYVIVLDRERLYIILDRTPKTLKESLNESDKRKVNDLYEDYKDLFNSIHIVYYNQSDRVVEVIYSYPNIPQGFDLVRGYGVDDDVHSAHLFLKCISRPIRNPDVEMSLRSSCPIFHGDSRGIEGYVLVLWKPGDVDDSQLWKIESALRNVANTIGK